MGQTHETNSLKKNVSCGMWVAVCVSLCDHGERCGTVSCFW